MSLPFLTLDKFKKIFPKAKNPDVWFAALSQYLEEYNINTPKRVASFFAQIGTESGGLTILEENLNYRADRLLQVFPKYFKTMDEAQAYAHNPEMIANRVYGSRMGNGPEASGEGFKYRGRGLIQLTGKNNYSAFSNSAYGDDRLLDQPELVATPDVAIKSACWYWDERNLNSFADQLNTLQITKTINGGVNGLGERLALFTDAFRSLSV